MAFRYVSVEACVCGHPLTESSSTKVEKKHSWGTLTFVRCPSCLTWMQAPRVSTDTLALWYSSPEYHSSQGKKAGPYLDYAADESHRKKEALRRIQRDLAPWLPKGATLLEIGCATGSFLAAAQDMGYSVSGIDLAEKFVLQARKLYNFPVACGDFMTASMAAGSMDAVALLGTFCNLQDTHGSLLRIRELLKPRGLLYLNFPPCDSVPARLYGRKYWMFAPSISAFTSKECCQKLLERMGFELIFFKRDRQMPSVTKLLGHSGLRMLYPFFRALRLTRLAVPFSIPIPGICVCLARKT